MTRHIPAALLRASSAVGAGLKHTRVVQSGSPPLYRLMLIGAVISGVVQASRGQAPIPVAQNSFNWFDYIFIVCQLGSASLALVSLYMIDGSKFDPRKLHRSLNFEFIGLLMLQNTIFVSVVASAYFNNGFPLGMSTWFSIMFWFWAWTRLREIRKAIGELTR